MSEQFKLPEAIITIEKANREKVAITALFGTGADSTAIKTEIAKHLGMKIYRFKQKFMEFDTSIIESVGVTQARFKLKDPPKEDFMRIYVFDKLNYDLILGANFAHWSSTSAMVVNHSEWALFHYNKGRSTPFQLTIEVPDKISYDDIFRNQFLKVFGPEIDEKTVTEPQPSTSANFDQKPKPKKHENEYKLKEKKRIEERARKIKENQEITLNISSKSGKK